MTAQTVFSTHDYFLSIKNNREEVVFLLLKFAIKDFMEDREFQNVTKKTLRGYDHVLSEVQLFCAEKEMINAGDVSQAMVKSYLIYCKNVLLE